VDHENGNLLHLPVDGGAVEQPVRTSAAFRVLQKEFCRLLERNNRDQASKIRLRGSRR
jgi:hypothetical protein